LAPLPLEREAPLLEREALLRLRVDAADLEPVGLERADPSDELRFDEPLLLRAPREADLLPVDLAVAIHIPPQLGNSSTQAGTHLYTQ
jgi:hypothetical protein